MLGLATNTNLEVNPIQSKITAASLAKSKHQSVPLLKISFSVPPKYISFNGTLKLDAISEVYLTNNFNDSNSFLVLNFCENKYNSWFSNEYKTW